MTVFKGLQSFAEWQATGTDVGDLSAYPELQAQDVYGPGRIYDDGNGGYLEGESGEYSITLGNDSHFGELESLERELWAWLVNEGYYTGAVGPQG